MAKNNGDGTAPASYNPSTPNEGDQQYGYSEPVPGAQPPQPSSTEVTAPQAAAGPAYPPPYAPQGAYAPYPPQGAATNDKVYDHKPPAYGGQYQQPPQYPSNYGATTITAQPAVVSVVHIFSDQPMALQCPNCQQMVTTQVVHETGTLAWLLCLIMFVLGLWLCCWIPFVVDDLQDVVHICPRCRRQLGRHRKM